MAVEDGLLATNRLKAEIEKLKGEIRILRGAAPSSGQRARETPQQEEKEEPVTDSTSPSLPDGQTHPDRVTPPRFQARPDQTDGTCLPTPSSRNTRIHT